MRRLRPVREPSTVRYERGVVAFGAVVLGIVILCHRLGELPLAEAEAPLAIAIREHASGAPSPVPALVSPVTATVALAGVAPRIWGEDELDLRLTGALSGALALALFAHLGGRLFDARAGALAAILLVALPAGRLLLGRELGAEPFVALTSLTALLAIWQLEHRRAAAVLAGVAGGVTIALGGASGLWLPVLAIGWLRLHRGLTWGSLGAVTGYAAATLAVAALAVALFAGRTSFAPLVDAARVPTSFRPIAAACDLLPLLPLVLLGLRLMPPGWTSSKPIRFVGLWLVLALLACLAGGAIAPVYAGVVLLVAAVVEQALEIASRRAAAVAVVLALGGAIVLTLARARAEAGEVLDRWAVRESGRFVGRLIPADERIAAGDRVRARLAYYGNRQVERLGEALTAGADIDYVVLERTLVQHHDPNAPLPPLRSIAEFGGWAVARVEAPTRAAEKP